VILPVPRPRALLLAGCALATAMLPALAFAADEPAGSLVDSVIVTARPDPEDPTVVADARRRLSQTPGAVSVISAESYRDRFAAGLDDVLRDAPGVYVQKKWGGDMRLSIRGSGIGNNSHNRGTVLAQDGLPFNEADGYGDFQLIDPLNARYVEVYKGGNALRFGGSLLGGAINFITPTGADAGFAGQVRIDGGSFGTLREHLALAKQWGDWDAYGALTNATSQGYRRQSQGNLQFGTLNVGRAFGQDREVRLYISGGNVAQEIPGALTLDQTLDDPRAPNPGNLAGDNGRNMRSLRGALQATWRLDDQTVLQAGAYAIWKDLDHPIFQVLDQESRNYGVFGRIDWTGKVGGMKADLFAGAWARTGDMDAGQYINVKGARGVRTAFSTQNAQAVDIFAEGRLFVVPGLALVAGGTWGWAGRDYQAFKQPGGPASFDLTASRDYDGFAPRIGVLWEGASGAQLFANLTRSIEPPNFSALSPTAGGFSPLRAQEAWTLEAGARGRAGAFTWDLAAYRAQLDGELLAFTLDQDHPASTFNADRTIHQGLEAGLDWRPAARWRLRQSLTWSDFRFDGDAQYGDNRLPVVPQVFYRAEVRYDHPAGWFVAPSVEWSPTDAFVDFANTTRSPAYALLALNAGWTGPGGVSLFLDARNLTGERYVSNVNSAVTANAATAAYWPGDGRSIYLGLAWNF
jgi:iron complex outermembrane receptor protein